VLLGANPDTDLHQPHLEDITMRDEFPDTDLDTPTEADLELAYGGQYLGTVDLGDRKIRGRIQKVRKGELTGQDGRKRTKFIVYFDALDKPLALNKTNKDSWSATSAACRKNGRARASGCSSTRTS
jgi:hypothetical protein